MDKGKKDYGVIYIATGDKYVKEAENSAQSLSIYNPEIDFTLITDKDCNSNVFSNIKVLEFENEEPGNWKKGLVFKIMGFAASPYKKTLFIDTDTYICDDISDVFGMLDFFDLLICPDYYDKSNVKVDGQIVKGYFPYNTGVVAFRESKEIETFLMSWENTYLESLDEFWSDQPAFMKALLLNNLKIHTLSSIYNCRFLNNVAFPNEEKVKILHGRSTPKIIGKIITSLNKNDEQRVWVAIRGKCYSWIERNPLRNSVNKLRNLIGI